MGATNFSSSSVVVHRFFPASPANSGASATLLSKKSKKKNGSVFCSSSFSSSSKVAAKAAATVLLLMTTTTNTAALAMNADVLSSGATITTESSSSVFNGRYSDPNHPGCLRGIEVHAKTSSARVFGEDGTPGCSAGEKTKKWELEGELRGKEEILIDFSKKGGPKNLLGKWTGSGVLFPDGNTWSKL